jgi:hypothetical protein
MNTHSQSPHPNPLPQVERGLASIRKFPLPSGREDQGEGAGDFHTT